MYDGRGIYSKKACTNACEQGKKGSQTSNQEELPLPDNTSFPFLEKRKKGVVVDEGVF